MSDKKPTSSRLLGRMFGFGWAGFGIGALASFGLLKATQLAWKDLPEITRYKLFIFVPLILSFAGAATGVIVAYCKRSEA